MIIYMYATRDEARTKGHQRTYGDGSNFSSIQQTASPRRHVVRTKASRAWADDRSRGGAHLRRRPAKVGRPFDVMSAAGLEAEREGT